MNNEKCKTCDDPLDHFEAEIIGYCVNCILGGNQDLTKMVRVANAHAETERSRQTRKFKLPISIDARASLLGRGSKKQSHIEAIYLGNHSGNATAIEARREMDYKLLR